ncbi:MAG: hypothetical protein ACM3TU_00505 [Bacillota bacterium]
MQAIAYDEHGQIVDPLVDLLVTPREWRVSETKQPVPPIAPCAKGQIINTDFIEPMQG